MEAILTIIFMGIAVHAATSIIVESELFRDSREWIDRRATIAEVDERRGRWLLNKLAYLHQCHMCAGMWVAAFLAYAVGPVIGTGFLGWLVTALAFTGARQMWLMTVHIGEALTGRLNRRPANRTIERIIEKSAPARSMAHTNHVHWSNLPGVRQVQEAAQRAATTMDGPPAEDANFETDEQVLDRWRMSQPVPNPRWPRDSFDDFADLVLARVWAKSNPPERM